MLCPHLTQAQLHPKVRPKERVCVDCVREGTTWVHIRTCQTCGVPHCCDSSKMQHSRKHAKVTGHPVIQSAEPGESWFFCFTDNQDANPL